jgi:hypothetical protein
MVMSRKENYRSCDLGHRKGAYVEVRKKCLHPPQNATGLCEDNIKHIRHIPGAHCARSIMELHTPLDESVHKYSVLGTMRGERLGPLRHNHGGYDSQQLWLC